MYPLDALSVFCMEDRVEIRIMVVGFGFELDFGFGIYCTARGTYCTVGTLR